MYSMIDTQYITRLRAKIFSGQKGRVLAGFHVGSIPYGYETELIDAKDDPGAIGRAATQGTKLKVVESEARVIRYIFELFSDGRSIWNICVRLNRDKVPSPRNAMAGKKDSEWCPDSIKRILRNSKYIGWNVWNASVQKEHPVTGKIKKEDKPAHEHIKRRLEEIRIVSDELWERAQARLRLLAEEQNARRLGGYNRAKNQEYLYSGLLFCGTCGARMKIGGVQGSGRYECPKHRRGEDCTNGLTIREAQASAQITEALANKLFTPECLEHLVPAVYSELQAAWQHEQDSVSKEEIPGLEQELRDCLGKIDNLIDRIEKGGSESLGNRLELRELERDRLKDKLEIAKRKKKLPITKKELHTLVQENVANLHAVLKSDVHLARKILFRLVKKLVLNPGVFEGRPMFTVVGEIDLLGQPSTQKDGVLLECSGTQTPQQHTDCYFCFCILLDPNPDECPLIQPLYELLTSEPALGLEPRTPSDWAERLRATLPDNGAAKRPFGYGAIARCFRIHRHLLEQRFDFVKVKNPVSIGHLYRLSIREASRLGDLEPQAPSKNGDTVLDRALPSAVWHSSITAVPVQGL
jgi:site-specific DNA recombinase